MRKPLTLILLYQRNVDQSECQLHKIQSKSIIYYHHYTNNEQTAVHCAYVNKQNPNPKQNQSLKNVKMLNILELARSIRQGKKC